MRPSVNIIKWVGVLTLGCLIPRIALAQTGELEPQRAALIRVGQALSRVVVKAKTVNEKLGYGFREGGCVFGVSLQPGGTASQNFSLQAGQSYVFIGGGDKTARNVDLVLRDSSKRIVGQDIEADAAPFILFRPKVTGEYTLALNLKTSWKGPVFCALTVLRKGGVQVPLGRIVEAAIRMDYASFDTFREYNGGAFNEIAGTWALYGSVLSSGQVATIASERYGGVNRGVVTVGDGSARELYVGLLDSTSRVVATGTKNGAATKLVHQIDAKSNSIFVSDKSSLGPTLVMTVLLDLPVKTTAPIPTPSSIPAPSPSIREFSPFQGEWKGEWANASGVRIGTFKIRVEQDGALSGHLAYPDLKIAAKFKGGVAADGSFYLSYSQSKMAAEAEGTMKFADESHQKIEGKLAFSSDDKALGSAQFTLEK